MSGSQEKNQLIKAGLQEFNNADINELRKKEQELRKLLEEKQKQQNNPAPKK